MALQGYDIQGVQVQKKIVDYLNSINFKYSDSFLFEYHAGDYKHYLGRYESKWCSDKNYIHDDSIAVKIENDKLIWYGYRSVSPGTTRTEITPIDKYRFRDDRSSGIYHLEFDDKGEVERIRYSQGPSFVLNIEKIR